MAGFQAGSGHRGGAGSHIPDEETLLGEKIAGISEAERRGELRAGLGAPALWAVPVALLAILAGPGTDFLDIALYFSRMAVVTFGGAYAVLAYVTQYDSRRERCSTASA